jgi:hypothetical protein
VVVSEPKERSTVAKGLLSLEAAIDHTAMNEWAWSLQQNCINGHKSECHIVFICHKIFFFVCLQPFNDIKAVCVVSRT